MPARRRKPTQSQTPPALILYEPPPATAPQLQLLEWQELQRLLAGCSNIYSIEEIRQDLRLWRERRGKR